MKKICIFSVLTVLFIILFFSGHIFAITILPNPLTPIPGAPSETLASKHDDFWAYSVPLLELLGYPGFDSSAGTGTLDVIIYTGAGTKDRNLGVGPDKIFNFEDPMDAPTGSQNTTFSGFWGRGDQPNGPVSVDNLLNYLQAFDPNNSTPIFRFDMNQTKKEGTDNLDIVGEAYIWNPNTNVKIALWAFDNVINNVFDPTEWVTAIGELTLGPYTVDHNKGSGKFDFLAYSDTMNLNQYAGNGYLFVTDFRMQSLNDGFEELAITGLYSPYVIPDVIPEPATMILLGSGLIGLAGYARRRFKK